MELRDESSGDSIVLTPIGYESPGLGARDDEYDRNWLNIKFTITLGGERWSRVDPALLTTEAPGIASWLRAVADGSDSALNVAEDGDVGDDFIEPTVGLVVAGRTADRVTVRAVLRYGTRRPDSDSGEDTPLDLTVAADDLREAADQWEGELAPFPKR